jgi:glycosyltransferase involved in cell wall biosynthesis
MLDQVSKYYVQPVAEMVIYNGRTPAMFDPDVHKEDSVLSVGRLWDSAKNVSLLMQREQEAQVSIVGWEREPGREHHHRDIQTPANVTLLGPKSQAELRGLYSRTGIYAAPSRYEPFGLAPLEAALSRCALVMNDNPVFHELWSDSALFFKKDDAEDCAQKITQLRINPQMRDRCANRAFQKARENFSAARMVEEYEKAYQKLASRVKVA